MKRVAVILSVASSVVVIVGACGWLNKPTSGPAAGLAATTQPAAKENPPTKGKPVASLPATTLWSEYDDNPLKADLNYKDKWIEVTSVGKSVQIQGRNAAGFSIVAPTSISTRDYNRLSPEEKKRFSEGYSPGVVCFIRPGWEPQFAQVLDDTQKIKIIGICKGRLPSADAYRSFAVYLDFCELVKPG